MTVTWARPAQPAPAPPSTGSRPLPAELCAVHACQIQLPGRPRPAALDQPPQGSALRGGGGGQPRLGPLSRRGSAQRGCWALPSLMPLPHRQLLGGQLEAVPCQGPVCERRLELRTDHRLVWEGHGGAGRCHALTEAPEAGSSSRQVACAPVAASGWRLRVLVARRCFMQLTSLEACRRRAASPAGLAAAARTAPCTGPVRVCHVQAVQHARSAVGWSATGKQVVLAQGSKQGCHQHPTCPLAGSCCCGGPDHQSRPSCRHTPPRRSPAPPAAHVGWGTRAVLPAQRARAAAAAPASQGTGTHGALRSDRRTGQSSACCRSSIASCLAQVRCLGDRLHSSAGSWHAPCAPCGGPALRSCPCPCRPPGTCAQRLSRAPRLQTSSASKTSDLPASFTPGAPTGRPWPCCLALPV